VDARVAPSQPVPGSGIGVYSSHAEFHYVEQVYGTSMKRPGAAASPVIWPNAAGAAFVLSLALFGCSSQQPAPASVRDAGADATMEAGGGDAAGAGADAPADVGADSIAQPVDAGLICSDPSPWTPDADPSTSPGICADSPPWIDAGAPAADAGAAAAVLTIDASALGGPWNRFYERAVASDHANTLLCTSWRRNAQNALRKAHAQAGFQYVRFHGVLDDDVGLYTEDATGMPVYRWARFDAVYDAIIAAGMRPIVEISFMPKALASDPTQIQTALNYNLQSPNISPPKDWTKWQNLMAAIVTHFEQRYGVDEVHNWYFEVWNEPSWQYSMGDGAYTLLYKNTIAGLLKGDPQVRVGGPAGSSGESPSLVSSLLTYASSFHAKLDFVTYHMYANDNSVVSDPTTMVSFHRSMAALLADAGFTGELVNDEFGPTSRPDVSRDNEATASFIAKTIHLIGTDTIAAPPTAYGYWAVSDLYEEAYNGQALSFNEGNYGLLLKGDPHIPESFDIAKPAFNAFRLLHMMGDTQLAVTGGTTADGVNAAATISTDGSALQVLVYNHVAGAQADPTKASLVTLTVDNIPFAPGPVRVRQFVVDHTHANAYTTWVGMNKPPTPTQAQWSALRDAAELCYYETTASVSGGSWTVQFAQNVYGVSLFEITHP
jgi:xylan 1,4-beta-xylosidase